MFTSTKAVAQVEDNVVVGTNFELAELSAEILALVGGGEGVVITT